MPHRRNNGYLRGEDRTDDNLFVEAPQVFQTASAASHHEDVWPGTQAIGLFDSRDNFRRRAVALNASGDDQDFCAWPTPPRDVQKIANRRAGGAGDKRDRLGVGRQRLFMGFVEQALLLQSLVQLPKRQLQCSFAHRLHPPHNELIFAVRRIDVDAALADHLLAIFGFKTQTANRTSPNDGVQYGRFVLEVEVGMAGAGAAKI